MAQRPGEPTWLQRLFESDFFDCWIGVSYLFKYTESGIQNYLCKRLATHPVHELEYFLPQLCHLLVTRSASATAIEELVVGLCARSPHSALFVLWFLRAYLDDLLATPDSVKYANCLTVLSRCQKLFEIVPGLDYNPHPRLPAAPALPSPPTTVTTAAADGANRGIAPGRPEIESPLILIPKNENKFVNPQWTLLAMGLFGAILTPNLIKEYRESVVKYARDLIPDNPTKELQYLLTSPVMPRNPPSKEELQGNDAFSYSRFLSENSIHPDLTPEQRRSLSIKHYIRAENRFVTALLEISHHLVSIPRENRQSVLVAELALLNNNLPARLCFPLWCEAKSHVGEIHDQIVRIPVKEAAVLNSKEKVPFVLQVEVLRSTHFVSPKALLPQGTNQHTTNRSPPPGTPLPPYPGLTAPPVTISSIKHHSSIQWVGDEEGPGTPPRRSLDGTPSDQEPEPSSPADTEEKLPTFPEPSGKRGLCQFEDPSSGLRIASIMLSQLTDKETSLGIAEEIQEIKERIVDALKQYSSLSSPLTTHDDPSAVLFQEDWDARKERIRRESPWGDQPNWDLVSVIVKYGDDLRQEQLTAQVIMEMKNVWDRDNIPIWVFPHRVLVVSNNSGFIETVPNAVSIHSLKKRRLDKGDSASPQVVSLLDYFIQTFGERETDSFDLAVKNFVSSLAGYSLITYFLQLRDRHNGNILLDKQGHMIHIDFGFVLSNSPGSVGFEVAPFKLSQEYLDLMGGVDSGAFAYFKSLYLRGFLALRKYAENFELLLKIMFIDSTLPCFSAGEQAVDAFRARFQTTLTDQQVIAVVEDMITASCNNVYTKLYDQFQYYTNGVLM